MKNIVITGASGGVGGMLSKGLANLGHHIIGLGRREDRLKQLVQEIINAGGKASYEVVDMTHERRVKELGRKIIEERGSIEVWINNVGVNNHNAIGPSWELSPQNWWEEVRLNLFTAFLGTHIAINLMKAQNQGYIINLGGGGVQEAKPFGSAYGAAKTALVKFTETVNLELEREGSKIRIFAFNPGFIRNERTEKLVKSEVAQKYMPKLGEILNHGIMSNPQDSIELIATLISGKADQLAGRYFLADEKSIWNDINNHEAIIKQEKNVLRIR